MRRRCKVICLPTLISFLVLAPLGVLAPLSDAHSADSSAERADAPCRRDVLDPEGDPIDLRGLSRDERLRIVDEYYAPKNQTRNLAALKSHLYKLCAISEGECIASSHFQGQCYYEADAPRGMTENRLRELQREYLCRPGKALFEAILSEPARQRPEGQARQQIGRVKIIDFFYPEASYCLTRIYGADGMQRRGTAAIGFDSGSEPTELEQAFGETSTDVPVSMPHTELAQAVEETPVEVPAPVVHTLTARAKTTRQHAQAELLRLRNTVAPVLERARKEFPGVSDQTALRKLVRHIDSIESRCSEHAEWKPLDDQVHASVLEALASVKAESDPNSVIRIFADGKDSDRSRVARDLTQLLRGADLTVRGPRVFPPPSISWVVHPEAVESAEKLANALASFLDVRFLALEDARIPRSEIHVFVQGRPRSAANGSVVYQDPYGYGSLVEASGATPGP
jgi:hypothetical protein